MSFFYDLNKKLDGIRATPEVTHQQLNERDMSRAAKDVEESAFQAAIGKKKYGDEGMKALQKAGRDNASAKTMSTIRNKYDKYDESAGPAAAKPAKPVPAKPSKPAPKGDFMGTIKGGVWTADPPKPGEKGVPAPSGDPEGVKEAGAPMTAKQKSFAKLAPPANKITFADKIAGAKKEVDEMLGDVAAEAMRSALGGGRGRNAEMDEENAFTAHKRPSPVQPKVGSTERGHKHDIKHTATGRIVTRRVDDQGNSVGADDADTQAGPRGRGRPKGTKGAIGAKGPSGRSKLMTKEGEVDVTDQGEYDQEGDMAKNDIKTIVRHAQALSRVLGDNDNLPEWVQSKLAKIEGMMISVDEYMQNQAGEDEEEPIAEKAVSKKQQRFMGMVHATQKGKKAPSKEVGKVAKTMKKSDAEDFAKTKHKGLPEKAKKKEVDENSDDGRLITKQTGPGQSLTTSTTGRVSATIDKNKMSVKPGKSTDDDADTASAKDTSSSKSNSMVGKGIYDSMNRELELMIAESMSVNMSDSTEGNKSLTVTATDDDAMKLAMILKSAGLGGHGGDMHSHGEEACDTCGMQDCGCGDVQEAVDENAPDWPTNTETSSDALQYAGGLNKPKADVAGNGQSTVPVVATRPHNDDLRRIKEMAGIKNEDNIDLGPTSPEVAAMSKDEVDAALRLDSDPALADMSPDEVNAELGIDQENNTYEDSIQRMREMAGIKEWEVKLDSPPRTGSYPDQLYGKDKERYDAVQTGSGPESQRVNQYYQNKNAGSYDSGQKYTDERDADYADRLNAVRAGRIANNELTPGEWIQKGTNAVRKAFGGQDKPLQPAKTVVDLDGPSNYPSARYVGSDEFNKRKYLDPKADAAYKARQKALFPDDFKEGKGDGNLANNAKPYDKVTQGDVIAGRLGKDEKGGKEKQVEESIFALTNQWKAYKG
jgi:hypothetical protein